MKRTILALLALGLVTAIQAAPNPPSPVLALTAGGLGSGSRLVALEPRTLEPRGSIRLPGWAFGREWARSPDGTHVALVPKPSEADQQLFVVGLRGSPRDFARLPLSGGDVCRLAWPSSRRLLIVLTRGACYRPIASARVVVVDPLRARVIRRYRLPRAATVVATAPAPGGLALLVADHEGATRVVLISPVGTRTIRLPQLQTRPRPLDKSWAATAIGLAVDTEYAYVVEPTQVIQLGLASGEIRVGPLPGERGSSSVQVLPVRPGVLAITGTSHRGRAPLGLRFVDIRNCRVQMIDRSATGIALAGATLLAFQPSFGRLARGTTPIGLRGYDLDGATRFRALAGQPVIAARAQDGLAYVAAWGRSDVSVVDLRDGRVERLSARGISIPELL